MQKKHAVWVSAGVGTIARDELIAAVQDRDEHVRHQAILAAESLPMMYRPSDAVLRSLTRDHAASVRFQARLTASRTKANVFLEHNDFVAAREWIFADAEDTWMRRSILFSAHGTAEDMIKLFWTIPSNRQEKLYKPGELVLIEDLSELDAANDVKGFAARAATQGFMPPPELGLALLRGRSKIWARKAIPQNLREHLVPVNSLVHLAEDQNPIAFQQDNRGFTAGICRERARGAG